jgi:vacuolar-type H+-ATPase subunit I/STV1
MNTSLIIELHHKEHQDWLSKLNFFQDEIKVFQNELASVLHKNLDHVQVIEHVEEYRTIFLSQFKKIDDLRHSIIEHEKYLSSTLTEHPENAEAHRKTGQKLQDFSDQFEALRQAFRRFASRNMSPLK